MEPKNKIQVKRGDVYAKLTIIKEVACDRQRNGTLRRRFLCSCECGGTVIVQLRKLREGRRKSCGCMAITGGRPRSKVKKKKILKGRKGHGRSKTREYRVYKGMSSRCNNPKDKSYKHYGGRGIYVAKEWDTFEKFYADMGPCPEGKEIDRINNEGPYAPWNCRWATREEQHENKRPHPRDKRYKEKMAKYRKRNRSWLDEI